MKNAAQIINSIQSRPQFSKLSYYKCIKIVQSMFTAPVQKMINFAYIKNRTLFFVFNHPIGKQEFDNNIQSIKSALKFYMPQECKECEESLFDDIKAFVTHTPKKNIENFKEVKQVYKERSSGNFEINIDDKKLNSLVRSIQKIIKETNSNES
ncbi:MAG: hypothetical protein A3E21_02480 [Sulfurimonas sp. RIFCSPHIGHO2_12_FULL_36_9]|nr:MAG: hypothetical protein A3E21_02480 [Sulfurimonas sp. RIFCSPHIGHO2_12_FULL_36_9]OHE00141.1 MAG: hypothetical protein A3J26_05330 [Sulfurimonas sp. RIFCSPLOWO2_02_FULL_36_28]OHE02965.1 MAG: hypothetical protein A2W82_07555 [Sulfurimonas sp. RIFCSPLOWO2_12_36_12]OHE07895.1 MAG: hypothetical protein A3K14_03040 [Sulfurimonas sp. RIFCSPLOWO2_12_FULL_36_74]